MIWLCGAVAFGAESREQTLTWDLSVKGVSVGTRTLTVRYLEGDAGTDRALETTTDINGQFGPMKVRWRQRMTAHVEAREPASFHSVIDHNGSVIEVQGRWTPSAWIVTTIANGKARAQELAPTAVDLSTADLLDPESRRPLSQLAQARILSAETGEVLAGTVEALGVQELTVGGQSVPVTSWAWTSPQGRSEVSYAADGFLVRQVTQLLGVTVEAVLRQPPPGGIDDFPVATGRPAVEMLDL